MSSTGNFVQSEFRYEEGKSPLTLLAETCRNIGVDTTTIKLTKSVIDHTKSSSSAASVESRKSNDSCRLSVSPIRNGSSNSDKQSTPITQTNRPNVNSLTGSNNNSSNSNSSNNNNSNGSSNNNNNNNNSTSIISVNGVREQSNKCSFKPYEDHVTSKRPCTEESKRSSGTPTSRSPSNSDKNNNNSNNSSSSNNSANRRISSESPRSNKGRESVTRSSPAAGNSNSHLPPAAISTPITYTSNGYDDLAKKHHQHHMISHDTSTPSSSSASAYSSATSLALSSSSSSLSTVTTQSNSKTASAINCCLPHPTASASHHSHNQLTVDSVSKFVPYPSISPYLGLPGSYEAAVAAANAAARSGQGHCHSPSMCRNPFCPECRFNAATNGLGQVGGCPAGCTQCFHVSSMASSMGLAAALQANSYLPNNAFYPPPPPHGSHQQNNQPGANVVAAAAAAAANGNGNMGKPNICSWMVGNTFCGKRFSTAEELHQHLRNHTSSDPGSVSALAFLGSAYPHLDPMLTSPIAGLRRTAFDPVNRYHPYKPFSSSSPLTSLPNGLSGLPSLSSPAAAAAAAASQLNMHYPAYGPYTGRLGPPIPP